MPADIFEGDDAESVAAYVASVAGLPAAAGGETGGGTETGGGAAGIPRSMAVISHLPWWYARSWVCGQLSWTGATMSAQISTTLIRRITPAIT